LPEASLLFELKRIYDDGRIIEARIWAVPLLVRGSDHQLKYSLFYGSEGERLVGYDNEAGKGDHRHYEDRQEAYAFTTVENVVADFIADVSKIRGGAL
jgi:hypothetical protein